MKVIVEADGGSRGNPGVAGYGAVVFDACHQLVLAERAEPLGTASNNVAEYRGLIAGLTAARALGAAEVVVRMDSKLVVEQMSGRWQVKHPTMQELNRRARGLAAQFDSVSFQWIPRAQNAHADHLSNVAMDGETVWVDGVEAASSEDLSSDVEAADSAAGTLFNLATSEQPPSAPSPAGWIAATGEPVRLLLLRHGQTELSIERRYSGQGDPELTELGRWQAGTAARRLSSRTDVAAVISSPLRRARVTADLVATGLNVPVETRNELTETDFGEWEGLTFAEAALQYPVEHRAWLSSPSIPAPGGESFEDVDRRVAGLLEELRRDYAGKTVVVVSHVTPIKSIIRKGLDVGPQLMYRLHLDLASLSEAMFYPDGASSVHLVNDTSHMG
jgi:probable phosphoglycerate mutase